MISCLDTNFHNRGLYYCTLVDASAPVPGPVSSHSKTEYKLYYIELARISVCVKTSTRGNEDFARLEDLARPSRLATIYQ